MKVFTIESTEEHMVGEEYATCIEGIFATEDAAREYLVENGFVEEEGEPPIESDEDGHAVSNAFHEPDYDGRWNQPEFIIACWNVRR